MKLNLKNPIIFFDLETTGLDIAKDRIVELCYIRIEPNGNEEAKSMRINPEIHIPEEASRVHGIYDADVKDCPTFKQIAKTLWQTFEGCDLAGYNSNKFDIPLLVEEFMRSGVEVDLSKRKLVDVQNIYHKLERRTLIAAYKYYCGKDLETPTARWPTHGLLTRCCKLSWTSTLMICRTTCSFWQTSQRWETTLTLQDVSFMTKMAWR